MQISKNGLGRAGRGGGEKSPFSTLKYEFICDDGGRDAVVC